MSDVPSDADLGGEELDLGEVDEDAEGQDVGEADASDEGDAGDDGEEQGQDAGQEGDVEPPPRERRPGRSERLRERLAETERKLAEAQGFRQAAEQFQRQPQQPQVNHEAERVAKWEADNLPMMSAQEVAGYYYNKGLQQTQQQMLYQQLQTEDRLDKRDYDQQARSSKVHAQYRDEVERVLASERQAGNLRASRDDILHRLVGRDAMDRATRAAPKQRAAAASRVRAQRTQPTNGRGDGAAGGGRQNSLERDYALALEGLRKGHF